MRIFIIELVQFIDSQAPLLVSRMRHLVRPHRWPGAVFLLALLHLLPTGMAMATEVPKAMPDVCDREWDRIKGIAPMEKADYERALSTQGKLGGVRLFPNEIVALNTEKPAEAMADLYYLLARVPFVIGAEQLPTAGQREDWLEKAGNLGHKAAKAALMRLRYQSNDVPVERRVSRETYLKAALEAAEAGDPEFATVLMDTARDTNHAFHCRQEDRDKSPTRNGCNAQSVVKPMETRKWAEVAARGGNPHAKNLLCTMHYFGTSPHWGAEKDDNLAFQWCFATHQTACSVSWNVGLLALMYERGQGTPKNLDKGAELRRRYPLPYSLRNYVQFPQIAR